MIRVVKRSGRVETLDITKIQKYTSGSVEGLMGVSQSELEVDANLHFRDMISSKDIQKTLIKTAVDKIDIDRPNWTFVASRLFLYDLYHRVSSYTGYKHLRDYLEKGEAEGRILLGLKEKYDLNDLNFYIRPERDLQFTYLGIKTLYDRYLLKDSQGEPIELPQHLFMGVAMFLAQNEKDCQGWAKKFYDMMSKFEVMPGTPTISNARTPRHQLSSCFPKGEKVLTYNGFKNIEKIEIGDFVVTHKNRFKKVYKILQRDYCEKLYSFDISGFERDTLKCTSEHPILAIAKDTVKCIRKGNLCIFSQKKLKRCFKIKGEYREDCEFLNNNFYEQPKWIEAKDIKIGDFMQVSYPTFNHKERYIKVSDYIKLKNLEIVDDKVMIKREACGYEYYARSYYNNQINPIKNTIPLNSDFMRLIGYYLAEGYVSEHRRAVYFTFGSKELDYINDTVNIIKNLFDIKVNIIENSDNSTTVSVHNKLFANFIYALTGSGFNKKELTDILLYAQNQIELLVGVFRGDGCTLDNGISLSLSNKTLIKQLYNIALREGLTPKIRVPSLSKLATTQPYILEINYLNDKKFVELVGKNLEKIKVNLYDKNGQKVGRQINQFWFNNNFFTKVNKVKTEDIDEQVYNLEVEDDHSYVVNNIAVHNCYIGSTPDNIEGIFDAYKEMALLSKFGGGIGWDWSQVRGMGSYIDGHKHAAGGIVPFLKIANDVAIAVDQLGTRRGAIAVYVEPWHIDIKDFLDLKKNSGEERRRAHDLFPALWLNDLFMQRVQEDATWTLFDPYEVRELTTLYGEEFTQRYLELEKSDNVTKSVISAKGLWKEILRSYFETGNPFLTFKDTANRRNPNKHSGLIRSSNLCCEIFQNTSPNYYKIKVTYSDKSIDIFEEEELITVDSGMTKPAKKITALDCIGEKQVWMVDKEMTDGDTAVCNLASINLSKVNTKEDMARVVPIAIRMLDNVIDLNFYPLAKVKKTNEKSRAIGLGVMGEAQMLAESKIKWGSDEHFLKIDEVMESVSYYAIKSSSDLAVEKGIYPMFKGSEWSQGIFPIDNANKEASKLVDRGGLFGYTHDWQELKEKVKKDGMRNGYLMAIAPTSSISILTGTTQAIEPVYKRKWYEENLSGMIPVVVPNLSPDTWEYYTPSYDLNQNVLIKAGAIRQKWIDQGQSLNIFLSLDKASGKYLNEIYMNAWKYGLKSTYYLRSQSPEAINDVADRSQECIGCQ
ncbi:Ribonucleotide reductase of class Ia (aerobic), alpha subunit [hydrothermal vent metagenome]|uniref:ribonucleoside-diphosphate reductase n=1 Tax=hydrothermal vent metagenome TaxID=652676 RepID=A0A1W1CKZ7_9ZZZZ